MGTRVHSTFEINEYPYWSKTSDTLYILDKNKYEQYGNKIGIVSLQEILENKKVKEISLDREIKVSSGIDVKNDNEILLTINNQQMLGLYKLIIPSGELQEIYYQETDMASGGMWSPDGKWILFRTLEKATGRIRLLDEKDGKIYTVSTGTLLHGATYMWYPNSEMFAFTRRVGGKAKLFITDINSVMLTASGCELKPIEISGLEFEFIYLYAWIN